MHATDALVFRAQPHRGPDALLDGYRISGVRRGGGVDRWLHNGDVLRSANGLPLTSVEQVVTAVESLRTTTRRVQLGVGRRGAERTVRMKPDLAMELLLVLAERAAPHTAGEAAAPGGDREARIAALRAREQDGGTDDTPPLNLEGLAISFPHLGPDGVVDGYRVSGIRRDGLFDRLGIRNGDIIHAANDLPLTTEDQVHAALDQLRASLDPVHLELTRRGLRTQISIDPSLVRAHLGAAGR